MTTPTAPASDREADHTAEFGGSDQFRSLPPNCHASRIYVVEPHWTRRRIITRNPDSGQKTPKNFESCAQWLMSADAMTSIKWLLQKYRLPEDAEDVRNDAAEKILKFCKGNPDHVFDNPAGYCYRAIENLLKDALSGRTDDDEYEFDPERDGVIIEGVSSTGNTSGDDANRLDEKRAYFEASGRKPGVVSAALSYVILIDGDDIDCDDLPSPRAGAKPVQALWWPCLWLAYRDETMFPDDSGGSAAQRKRLQHAKNRSKVLLKDSYGGRPESEGGVQ